MVVAAILSGTGFRTEAGDVMLGSYICTYDFGSDAITIVKYNPIQPTEVVEIPAFLYYDSAPCKVAKIGQSAFYNHREIRSISIPGTVTGIETWAFLSCSYINELKFADGDKDLWNQNDFSSCPVTDVYIGRNITGTPLRSLNKLTNATISSSVTKLSDEMLSACSALQAISIPASVTEIGNNVFRSCPGLASVRIEDSPVELSLGYHKFTSVENNLFYDCPIKTLYIGRDLSYKSSAVAPFRNQTQLSDLSFGKYFTKIQAESFIGCTGLTSIDIPANVTYIGNSAFEKCTGLISVTIPNSVTTLSRYAFRSCSSLTSVIIGTGVRDMLGCFNNSPTIRSVKMAAAIPPTITKSTFDNEVYSKAVLQVRRGAKELYAADAIFGLFKNIEEYDLSSDFKLSFSRDSYACAPGSSMALTLNVDDPNGEGYMPEEIVWSSSDPSVATVSSDGTLTGVSYGSATITATIANIEASTTVNIVPLVDISNPYILVPQGGVAELNHSLKPSSANMKVMVSVDDSSIASVDPTNPGTIHGLRCGTTKALYYADGYAGFPTEVVIVVYDAENIESTEGFGFKDSDYYTYVGTTRQIALENAPYGARWESSSPEIASVDIFGYITANSAGTAVIRATSLTTEKAATAEITCHVYSVPAESMSLSGQNTYTGLLRQPLPTATVYPERSCQKVIWTSPDNSAEILNDDQFRVTNGSTALFLRAEAADGSGVSQDFHATIDPLSVNISGALFPTVGKEYKYTCSVSPDNFGDNYSWSISGKGSISGSSKGRSVIVKCSESPGEFTLTVKNDDYPDLTASETVTVARPKVTRIVLSQVNLTLNAGSTAQLSATVSPYGANTDLIWTVMPSDSKNKIVGVAMGGHITAVQPGVGVITAYDPESGVFGFCNLTVESGKGSYVPASLPAEVVIEQGSTAAVCANDRSATTIGWSIKDLKIATFSSYPYGSNVSIRGNRIGETELSIAQTNSTSTPSSCKLIVVEPGKAYSISFEPEYLSGNIGDTFKPQPVILPSSAAKVPLQWSSSDDSVATVSESGTITITGNGSCMIYAQATDGTDVTGALSIYGHSGIETIEGNTASMYPADLYTIDGRLIGKLLTDEDLSTIKPGIYLIRSGSRTSKIVIR